MLRNHAHTLSKDLRGRYFTQIPAPLFLPHFLSKIMAFREYLNNKCESFGLNTVTGFSTAIKENISKLLLFLKAGSGPVYYNTEILCWT